MSTPEEHPPAIVDAVGSRDFHPHPGDLPELGEWGSGDEVLDAVRAAADAAAGRHARIPAPRKATS